MKLLVVTSEPITAAQLRAALDGEQSLDDAEVKVLAPALHTSAIRFWFSDADEAIAKADAVWRETVDELGDADVAASGDTGESDPLEAIDDALRDFEADRIVVFMRDGSEGRFREDVDESEIERRFGVPVEHALVPDSQ